MYEYLLLNTFCPIFSGFYIPKPNHASDLCNKKFGLAVIAMQIIRQKSLDDNIFMDCDNME